MTNLNFYSPMKIIKYWYCIFSLKIYNLIYTTNIFEMLFRKIKNIKYESMSLVYTSP